MELITEILFFLPGEEEQTEKGVLIREEDGHYYLEVPGKQFPEIFGPIQVLYAQDVFAGEKYSFVQCVFVLSDFNRTRYQIQEVYKGSYLADVLTPEIRSVNVQLYGLVNWINKSRFIPLINFVEDGNINVKDQFTKVLDISAGFSIEFQEYAQFSYSQNEAHIKNAGQVVFRAEATASRYAFNKVIESFSKMLYLFTGLLPRFTKLEYELQSGTVTELLIQPAAKTTEWQQRLPVSLVELEDNLPIILKRYYFSQQQYDQVLDLIIASQRNKSPEISFLNLATTFEVFHKYFMERVSDNALRQELFNELKAAGLAEVYHRKWDLILRCYHILREMQDFGFVKLNFSDIRITSRILKDSRNYYTHIADKKERLWSREELYTINWKMRQLLVAIVLKFLGVPDPLLVKVAGFRSYLAHKGGEKNTFSFKFVSEENPDA